VHRDFVLIVLGRHVDAGEKVGGLDLARVLVQDVDGFGDQE